MKKRNILVVDNDVIYACRLREHLLDIGFRVTLAENCKEGKKVLGGKVRIDLVILDNLLPDGSGVSLLKTLARNEQLQRPPVIISSSVVDSKDESREALLRQLPMFSRALIQAHVHKTTSLESMDTVMDLIFQSKPPSRDSKTMLTGDYHHPKRPRQHE